MPSRIERTIEDRRFHKLNITSEFNEVYFSEMGEAEVSHSRDPRKINLGEQGKTLGVLGEADPANR
jgi:hypothetical protein